MANLCIIPARGGSKRIPGKNVRNFLGKPIISYAIETARESGLFDEIMVSTDDGQIAEISRDHGAVVPFLRSKKNADDFATTSDVLVEVVQHYRSLGKMPTTACCIYPCSPLLKPCDLQLAADTFVKSDYDVLLSAVAFSYPVQRSFYLEGSTVSLKHPEYKLTRSQDLESTYHDAGAFYFFNPYSFLKCKDLWEGNTGAYILPEYRVQDIDTLKDWQIAELKYTLFRHESL